MTNSPWLKAHPFPIKAPRPSRQSASHRTEGRREELQTLYPRACHARKAPFRSLFQAEKHKKPAWLELHGSRLLVWPSCDKLAIDKNVVDNVA